MLGSLVSLNPSHAPAVRALRRRRHDGLGVGPSGHGPLPLGRVRVDGAPACLHPRRRAPALLYRAICLADGDGEDGRPVGAISVTPTGDPNSAELGYVLARAHWGKGVATAAVKRTVATVFGEVPGLERVEALVNVANPSSQRVLEKAGFTREAVLRKYGFVKGKVKDRVMFSFMDTDPLVE
ncbi:hypothetical protein QOZ80_3AG0212830 [Eleusine coracana subsp. coracana]|nr:hypothetical protein QOZ80_3AG0212830 [Eleusine coracana subsp. coracana]